MKSNDWGETQEIADDKWEDFSSPSASSQPVIKTSNTTPWVQDKPSTTSQTKNDWDTDAFFNEVLTSTTKPKLKTSRR
jgi:hypothetical protein